MTRRKTRVKRINVGRQRRVSATAALALKREFEQLLDAGKLFRFIGRDERGRGFTMYSTHMDAEFLSTQLESIVRGCCFMSAAMRDLAQELQRRRAFVAAPGGGLDGGCV